MEKPDPAPRADSANPTRESLLEAAEVLFAEGGIERSSLRAITRRAGVNLAAVNYHFGSKEGLVRAVFERRLAPIQEERMAGLAACRAGDGRPRVECLLRAFLEPVVRFLDRDRTEGGAESGADGSAEGSGGSVGHPGRFARLMGRALHEPSGDTRELLMQLFRPAVEGYTDAFAEALPHLAPEEVYWRFHFTVGTLAQTVSLGDVAHRFSGGACDPRDAAAVLDHMVRFLGAAWRAPAAAGDPT